MTEDFLNCVKAEFGITLPDDYVKFMRNYPEELEATKLDLGWCKEAISERCFLKNPERILKFNRDVRTPNISWLKDGSGWPPRFFVIGDDDCGNYFAINAEEKETAVLFYDHELASFSAKADSLESFKSLMIQETLEFNESERQSN